MNEPNNEAVEDSNTSEDEEDIEVTTDDVADHANTLAVALGELLVEKGIITEEELEGKFEELSDDDDDEDEEDYDDDEEGVEYDGDELDEENTN